MKWESKLTEVEKEIRIAIYFEQREELIQRIRKITGAKWSQLLRVWHLPDTEKNRIRFKIALFIQAVPSEGGIAEIEKFKQWLRSRRYSESTIKTYCEALKSFLVFYREKTVANITNDDVIVYNNEYILKNRLSASFQNQIVNAIKLFFRTVRETKIEIDKLHRPKRAKELPNVLSKEEVKLILNAHANIKHQNDVRLNL